MVKQNVVTLRLTSGELDVLTSIAREKGRRESRQAALIQLLRRAYRKACQAAGMAPKERLLYGSPLDNGLTLEDLEKEYDTLEDILAACQDARGAPDGDEYNDYGKLEEIEPEECETDDDLPGGWIAC